MRQRTSDGLGGPSDYLLHKIPTQANVADSGVLGGVLDETVPKVGKLQITSNCVLPSNMIKYLCFRWVSYALKREAKQKT